MIKGLEALKYLKENKRKHWLDNDKSSECLNSIEKELKALEILKAFDFDIEDYTEELNGSISVKFRRIILDKEEIDLLKEVLL